MAGVIGLATHIQPGQEQQHRGEQRQGPDDVVQRCCLKALTPNLHFAELATALPGGDEAAFKLVQHQYENGSRLLASGCHTRLHKIS